MDMFGFDYEQEVKRSMCVCARAHARARVVYLYMYICVCVWYLDDDNILHPNFNKLLDNIDVWACFVNLYILHNFSPSLKKNEFQDILTLLFTLGFSPLFFERHGS